MHYRCSILKYHLTKHVARKLIRGGSEIISEGVWKFKKLHTVYLNTSSTSKLIFIDEMVLHQTPKIMSLNQKYHPYNKRIRCQTCRIFLIYGHFGRSPDPLDPPRGYVLALNVRYRRLK